MSGRIGNAPERMETRLQTAYHKMYPFAGVLFGTGATKKTFKLFSSNLMAKLELKCLKLPKIGKRKELKYSIEYLQFVIEPKCHW